MSVHGEFRRGVGDAAAALRVAQASPLAEALERACEPKDGELSTAADAVLKALASAQLSDYAQAAEAVEQLTTLCRIILGR